MNTIVIRRGESPRQFNKRELMCFFFMNISQTYRATPQFITVWGRIYIRWEYD